MTRRACVLLAMVLTSCGASAASPEADQRQPEATAAAGAAGAAATANAAGGAAGADETYDAVCDCERISCSTKADEEAVRCGSLSPETSVTRVTWEGCELSALRLTDHHYGARHVYDASGELVGYTGHSPFTGWYYACGVQQPCPDALETACLACAGEVYAGVEEPEACAPSDP